VNIQDASTDFSHGIRWIKGLIDHRAVLNIFGEENFANARIVNRTEAFHSLTRSIFYFPSFDLVSAFSVRTVAAGPREV
jgi:hypothetical protein